MIPANVFVCAFGILGRNAAAAWKVATLLNQKIQGSVTNADLFKEFGNDYWKKTLIALSICAPTIIESLPDDLLKKLGITKNQLYKASETGQVVKESSIEQENLTTLGALAALVYFLTT